MVNFRKGHEGQSYALKPVAADMTEPTEPTGGGHDGAPSCGDHDDVYRRMAAEQIVAHLKLANWQFVKGPPLPPHGQLGKAPG